VAIVSNRGTDWACALAVGALTLALFVATVQPDVGGPEDTPKFQFLGYVLGTGHPPGYPLYVLLSHAFVQLPIGTIAYRANLFSAVMAAIACALTYVLGRQLGAGRWAAIAASTALATGLSFWTNAVFAEVYSLAAVMVALTIVCLIAWATRARVGWLLAAVATFSLGLGNHLTIVGIAPAAIIYVLVHNRRVLTPRVIAAVTLLFFLGVAQYGFIILRTRQGAPFLESRATSVSELVDVITAKQFASKRFAFTPTTLVTTQLPAVASAMRDEVGLVGLGLVIAGCVGSGVMRNGLAWLVIAASSGLLLMVLNLSGDTGGFITPVLPLVWALAAFGITTLADVLRRLPRVGVPVAATMTALTLLIPVARLSANHAAADRNKDSTEATFMREIVRQLPERAGLVTENYSVVSLLEYFLLTEEAGPNRGIVGVDYSADAIRRTAKDGRRVFALGEAATFMTAEGLRFERAASVTSPLGALYELVGEAPCVRISSDEWTDISSVLTTGSWVTTIPTIGTVHVATEIRDTSATDLDLSPRALLPGAADVRVTTQGQQPGMMDKTIELTRVGGRRTVFRVPFNVATATGRARLAHSGDVRSLALCSHVPPDLFKQGPAAELRADFESEAYFGPRWSLPERVGDVRVRRGPVGSTLLLPLERDRTYDVTLEVTADRQVPLEVSLNGTEVGGCDLDRNAPCVVRLAATVVRDGTNALALKVPKAQAQPPIVFTFTRARIQRLDAYNGPGR
jgi:hypothetical protein